MASQSDAFHITAKSRGLVHLNMELPPLPQALGPLVIVDALLLAHALEHVRDTRHHALQACKRKNGGGIDTRALVFSLLFQFLTVQARGF